jgi:hypothetical protein
MGWKFSEIAHPLLLVGTKTHPLIILLFDEVGPLFLFLDARFVGVSLKKDASANAIASQTKKAC